jgi:hypothetical protein
MTFHPQILQLPWQPDSCRCFRLFWTRKNPCPHNVVVLNLFNNFARYEGPAGSCLGKPRVERLWVLICDGEEGRR